MGSVLVRPGGRVVVQWVDGAGRARQRTVRATTAAGGALSLPGLKTEARRILGEVEGLAERQRLGLAPRPLSTAGLTFGDLHRHWEETRGKALRSSRFLAFVRPHVKELLQVSALDVTTAAVDRLLATKAAHLAPKSLNHIRGHLHAVFEEARKQGGPWEGRVNPVTAARKFKVAEQSTEIVTPAEWPLLAPELLERWRGVVAVAFFTGLRRGDIFGLRKADVDLERMVLAATISKSSKHRLLPIADQLRPYLEEALATPGPDLFRWPKGKRLPNLIKMLRRACGRAGLVQGFELRCRRRAACGFTEQRPTDAVPESCPSCSHDSLYARAIPRRVRFHDLRHSFGTAVVAAGGTGAGQALMAHSDPRMTARYTHLADGLLAGVVERAFRGSNYAGERQNPGGGGSGQRPSQVAQRFQRVGPPGLEPGLRSRGERF